MPVTKVLPTILVETAYSMPTPCLQIFTVACKSNFTYFRLWCLHITITIQNPDVAKMVRANALDGSRWFNIPLPSIENSNESSSQSQSRQTREATEPRYFGVLAKQLAPSSTNLALSSIQGQLHCCRYGRNTPH